MNTTVVYHSADFDGIFCREIARRFLPDATLIGWNFGDPKVTNPMDGTTYVLDLSPECLSYVSGNQMVWIDHHKTSIDKWPKDIPGYRIDGVAACRLAWQWFNKGKDGYAVNVPSMREMYFDRKVNEPLAIQLAGEYDVWDKRNPWAETFQYGLRVEDPVWETLLRSPEDPSSDAYALEIVNKGEAAQKYSQRNDASICNSRTWLMEWEGLKWLCVNSARFNSLFFAAKDVPETGHDALLGFCFDGKNWTVSIYHAKHRTDLDLSRIAVKYGGGGHRGACGFTCSFPPFLQKGC